MDRSNSKARSPSSKAGKKGRAKSEKGGQEDEIFVVGRILGERRKPGRGGGGTQFKIRWKGYTEADDTWEDAARMSEEVPLVVKAFQNGTQPESDEDGGGSEAAGTGTASGGSTGDTSRGVSGSESQSDEDESEAEGENDAAGPPPASAGGWEAAIRLKLQAIASAEELLPTPSTAKTSPSGKGGGGSIATASTSVIRAQQRRKGKTVARSEGGDANADEDEALGVEAADAERQETFDGDGSNSIGTTASRRRRRPVTQQTIEMKRQRLQAAIAGSPQARGGGSLGAEGEGSAIPFLAGDSFFKKGKFGHAPGMHPRFDAPRPCATCGANKPEEDYSCNQWKKGGSGRRCKDCIREGEIARGRAVPKGYDGFVNRR